MIRWAACLWLSPLAAQAAPLLGQWCSPDFGPVLFVEADSLGVGEHTMCEWADPPGLAPTVSTRIDCVDYYFPDGQPQAVNPRSHTLLLDLVEADKLLMKVDAEDAKELERCDE